MRIHGLDAATYKEAYGLKRTASLWPPALAEQQRAAALDRDQGSIGREHLPHDGSGRPSGIENRLQTQVEASRQRKGIYTRGGITTKR